MLNENIGVASQPINTPPVSPPAVPPPASPVPSPSGGSGPLFKLVVIVAILSVVALVGAFSYYLYTLSQTATQKQVTTTVPTPTPPPAGGLAPTLSPSDKTTIVEQELNQTSLEDFEGDFQALQGDAAGL